MPVKSPLRTSLGVRKKNQTVSLKASHKPPDRTLTTVHTLVNEQPGREADEQVFQAGDVTGEQLKTGRHTVNKQLIKNSSPPSVRSHYLEQRRLCSCSASDTTVFKSTSNDHIVFARGNHISTPKNGADHQLRTLYASLFFFLNRSCAPQIKRPSIHAAATTRTAVTTCFVTPRSGC